MQIRTFSYRTIHSVRRDRRMVQATVLICLMLVLSSAVLAISGVARAETGNLNDGLFVRPLGETETPLRTFFGHRDTHFSLLADLAMGDPILWEAPDGTIRRYRVMAGVMDLKDRMRVPAAADGSTIALVTCWPFDAIEAGGPMRYLVLAAKA